MITLNKIYSPLVINDTRYNIVTGGRGSGKSFAITTLLCMMMLERDRVILFLRQTLTSAHISIIPEFVEKLELLGISEQFHITKTDIEHKETGSRILFRGIQTGSKNNTANLKSINGVSIMVVDEAEELTDEDTFDRIDLSIRKQGVVNKVMLVMNPSRVDHWIYKRFFKEAKVNGGYSGIKNDCTYIHTTYFDNIKNLDESFIEQLERLKKNNLKKYLHLVMGEWSDGDSDFALWSDDLINGLRVIDRPPLKRVVIAIDPAVTSKDTSDETGLIACGIGFDNHFYVLEDCTGTYTPKDWATKAIMMYRKWEADRIIGEVNNGGDLIEAVLRGVDPNIPYKSVHATRDKLTRAEPVASIYEQGKAHHVGKFLELEYEMTTWEGKKGEKSPNRIDALVWGATETVLAIDDYVEVEFEFI